MANWYVSQDGKVSSPISDDQLYQMVSDGFIGPSDHLSREGGEWIEAWRVPGLFPGHPTPPPPKYSGNRQRKPSSSNLVFVLAPVVLTMVVCGIAGVMFNRASREVAASAKIREDAKTPEQKERELLDKNLSSTRYVLEEFSKETIKKGLKAPTTAKFVTKSYHDEYGFTITVTGNVTSQNAFGAMLTKDFRIVYGRTNTDSEFKAMVVQFEGIDFKDDDLMDRVGKAINLKTAQAP